MAKQFFSQATFQSQFHDLPLVSKILPDHLKSTPFKTYAVHTGLLNEVYEKLDFDAYCEFFGFSKTSVYLSLGSQKIIDAALQNIQVRIVDRHTIVPYHLFRPAVALCNPGPVARQSKDCTEQWVKVSHSGVPGHNELHVKLRQEQFGFHRSKWLGTFDHQRSFLGPKLAWPAIYSLR